MDIRCAAAQLVHLVLPAAALAACSGSPSPFATAQRIGALEDAIGGPHAIGRSATSCSRTTRSAS